MGWRAWDHYEQKAHERWRALPRRERYKWRHAAMLALIAATLAAAFLFRSARAEEDLIFKRQLIEHNKQRDHDLRAAREADERKMQACRLQPQALIGLSRTALREKCGLWDHSNITASRGMTIEQMVYSFPGTGPLLVVNLENDAVTSAQGF